MSLIESAQKLREYLEGPACVIPGFDVPDEIWRPFCEALDRNPDVLEAE